MGDKAGEHNEELIFDDRRTRRAKVSLAGALVHAGQRYPCDIVDLSAGGCRAQVDVDFAVGMPVHVELAGHGRFGAAVIWVDGGSVGLGFAEGVGQILARLGPSAAALGLVGDDGDTGPAHVIDPT